MGPHQTLRTVRVNLIDTCGGQTGTRQRAECPEPVPQWDRTRPAKSAALFAIDYQYEIDSLHVDFAPVPVHTLFPGDSTR